MTFRCRICCNALLLRHSSLYAECPSCKQHIFRTLDRDFYAEAGASADKKEAADAVDS